MERERTTRESRDELLERILEETARKPYKPSPRVNRPTAAVKPVAIQNETRQQAVQQQPVQPAPIQAEKQSVQAEEANAQTQVFAGNDNTAYECQPMTAAEKIQKIKQEKAAAAKAAIMRKAEIDNSIMLQNAENESNYQQTGFTANDEDEKVNLYNPQDDFADEYYGEYEAEKPSGSVRVFAVVHYALYIVFTVFVILNYIVSFAGVSGDSMAPTLNADDKLLVQNVAYTPCRNDVVIIDNQTAAVYDENGNLTEKPALNCKIAKRIIALGGDTVDIDFENGTVTVNGEVLNESYISEPTTRNEGAFEYPLTIPEGYAFVLGDNRNLSKDSRHTDIGLVPVDEIVGKALMKVYPFGNFGAIE